MQKLQAEYPDEPLTGFFYDPNIHPYGEYQLRLLDVKRSCAKLGIPLIEGEYDFQTWLELVRGLENEPEKGSRCEVCFDRRFEVSAHKALELGEKKITTTLLVSPLKSQEQLKCVGDAFYASHGVEFVAVDYRKKGGTQLQWSVAKEEQLYRQDYCGCLYGLSMQREHQHRLMDEMFSPLDGRTLPASIEERLALYTQRMAYEEQGIAYAIVKERFVNYRLLSANLWVDGVWQWVHVLPYSILPKGHTQSKLEHLIDGVGYLERDEVRIIDRATYNRWASAHYPSIRSMLFSPPDFDVEVTLRSHIDATRGESPIIVVESMPEKGAHIALKIDAKSYEDKRELIVAYV